MKAHFTPLMSALLACFALTQSAEAKLLQIIHTNDLHSHLEHGNDPTRGGYAAVKAKIDQLRNEAAATGVESITLDAGDFSEGSQFYLAAKGESVWKVMDSMGFDGVAIGNHDWLLGPSDLERLLKNTRPKFPLLGANYHFQPLYENTGRALRPHIELVRGGIKIAVLGLTTNELFYKWRARDGLISDPIEVAKRLLPRLADRNDVVIALTHLGVEKDKELAAKSSVDIIVGGHSHTKLDRPITVQNPRGRNVPIVQTGEHGYYVGAMLIDVVRGKPVEVLSYRLEPVFSNGPKDKAMVQKVEETRKQLEHDFGSAWLYETVGQTEVALERQNDPMNVTAWSAFAVDAIRESVGADVALDVNEFSGLTQPAGPLNREQLFALYPHIFDFSDRYGWNVWTNKVTGYVYKTAVVQALKMGFVLTPSGFTYDIVTGPDGKRRLTNFKIGGVKLRNSKLYLMAVPEGLGRGAYEITPMTTAIFKEPTNTGIPIWKALEQKLDRMDARTIRGVRR